jgi:uncharacterized protein
MEMDLILNPLLGGILIGVSVTLMLLFNGRITGISGILASSISKPNAQGAWRLSFLVGLITGGLIIKMMRPELFVNLSGRTPILVLIAGLLVGYGTVMGSGCTSGHGICGVSRLSFRSIIATLTFILFGFLTVQAVRLLSGGSL